MAIKKSELYSSLWKSCDQLRGGMDASQYKDYVLVLLFVKYVSDRYAGQKDALIEVPLGGSFADMVALKGDYDIYQHLMSYWVSMMQDDVYMLVQDGWKASVKGQPNVDLIPQAFVIKRYFSSQQQIVDNIEADRDRITSQLEALCEEHGCEEGLLEDAKNDKGKLTKASVKARLTTIKHDSESDEERKLLNEFLDLLDQEAAASKRLKVGSHLKRMEFDWQAMTSKCEGVIA